MADEITLQMEGNTCTISIPEDTYIGRVKVYAPRRQFPVLTPKRPTATIQLLSGETVHLDAYGEGGEGDLLKTTFLLTEQGLIEQKSSLSQDVQVVVKPAGFNQQRAIEDYTELQRRISVGAYSERSAEHFETGTYPEDGVEESIDNLTELAASHGLEFIWRNNAWSLEPMSEETRVAREQAEEEPPDLVAEEMHRIESPGYNELGEDEPLYHFPDEEEEDEEIEGDGSGLHQCPYCYNLVNEEHEEFCRLNPHRNREIVP